MPDITMCKGDGCKSKHTCYRYKAKPSDYMQSYFLVTPIKDNGCEYYINNEIKEKTKGYDK
jgi:hypothetical protein